MHEIIRVSHLVVCPMVFKLFHLSWQTDVLKLTKRLNFKYFQMFGSFPQVFGQVKRWLMLKLHKIRRVLHAVAGSIAFLLFYSQG